MALGWADVDALEDAITEHQLREWYDFYELEPWGAEIGFLRTGIVASTLVNLSPNRKPGAKPASPLDFMPSQKPADLDPKRIRGALMAAFANRRKD